MNEKERLQAEIQQLNEDLEEYRCKYEKLLEKYVDASDKYSKLVDQYIDVKYGKQKTLSDFEKEATFRVHT